MNRTDAVWTVGRATIGTAVRLFTPLRNYGADRVPLEGGVVLAMNHFHWLDPPAFGTCSPRTIYYVGKIEVYRVPGRGQLVRAFGKRSARRGGCDRVSVEGTPSGCSAGGRGSARVSPARVCPARRWLRSRRTCRLFRRRS